MATAKDNRTTLQRRTLLTAAISAIGLAAAPKAWAAAAPMVELQVVDRETGQPARVWRHDGRLFVAGRPGARYSLRVTNNTGGRVLVVMSVDGVNILTGETAGHGQRGYVLMPYASQDVSGWRKSDTEVAAFHFAPLHRSYAARTGRPDDVGVIGVAAFAERAVTPYVGPPALESRAAPAAPAPVTAPPPTARAAPQSAQRAERLGTGHGEREWSAVTSVRFERATSYPQFVQRIEYDSHENLVAAGVIPRPRPRPVPSRPRPFPSSPDYNGYVPDPPRGR
jgi:hypothetical protein